MHVNYWENSACKRDQFLAAHFTVFTVALHSLKGRGRRDEGWRGEGGGREGGEGGGAGIIMGVAPRADSSFVGYISHLTVTV